MKKHLFSLILGSLCLLSGHAQNLRVHVKSVEQDLPFSCVLINGKYHSAADSTGRAAIAKDRLKTGDTLSARYVGAQEEFGWARGRMKWCSIFPGRRSAPLSFYRNRSEKTCGGYQPA